jgi:hypothetical protein
VDDARRILLIESRIVTAVEPRAPIGGWAISVPSLAVNRFGMSPACDPLLVFSRCIRPGGLKCPPADMGDDRPVQLSPGRAMRSVDRSLPEMAATSRSRRPAVGGESPETP